MKAVSIKAALVSSVTMIATASLAQTAPAVDPKTPQDVCQRLAAFVQERGGRVAGPTAKPITAEEVAGYIGDDNRFACRSAISIMHTSGVDIPPALLEAIGVPADRAAGAPRR